MATRSSIGYLKADGTVTAIYAHWDGYPAGNGRILQEHYQAAYKIGKLIHLGDVSVLAPNIGNKIDFDDREAQAVNNQCLFYGRDRGESNTECRDYASIAEWVEQGGQEYNYLWTGKQWVVNDHAQQDAISNYVFDDLETKVEAEVARLKALGYL